jgi:hypothetical protein
MKKLALFFLLLILVGILVGWQRNVVGSKNIKESSINNQTSLSDLATIGNSHDRKDDLINAGSVWKYLDNGTDQGISWISTSFNDQSWNSGKGELGFGDGDEITNINRENHYRKCITTYFRKSFKVIDPGIYNLLTLALVRDDGAVVYINGKEVYRSNLPTGMVLYSTRASANVDGTAESTWTNKTIPSSCLKKGRNVIAVEIHQYNENNSDLSFNLQLTGEFKGPITDLTKK